MRFGGPDGARHPITRDRLRVFLAGVGFPTLICTFLGAMVLTAAVLALGYRLTRETGEATSFVTFWRRTFMAIMSFPLDGTLPESTSTARQAVLGLTAVSGLVFPALFLGSVVFRLLISPAVFVFRPEITLMPMPPARAAQWPQGDHILAIRGYSATRLDLLDLHFAAVSQNRTTDDTAGDLRVNHPLELLNPDWPLASRHIPYTILLPLLRADVEQRDQANVLVAIQGRITRDGDTLFIHISGRIPALGTEFTERHSFEPLAVVSERAFGDVTVDNETPSAQWKGWDRFD